MYMSNLIKYAVFKMTSPFISLNSRGLYCRWIALLSLMLFLTASPCPLYAAKKPASVVDSLPSAPEFNKLTDAYSAAVSPEECVKAANRFFDYLYSEQFTDEHYRFDSRDNIDSVSTCVWYWAAEWCYSSGQYAQTVDYCKKALPYAEKLKSTTAQGDIYGLLGASLFRMSEFDQAADALNHCYEIDKQSGDLDCMSSTLNGIASVFVAAGKPEEAEKYFLEAIATNSLTDNLQRRAVLFGNTSEMYKSLGNTEKALYYAQQALDIERQLQDSCKIGVRLSQLANVQIAVGTTTDAKAALNEAMPLLQRCGNIHSWGICQNQMGDILMSEGDNEQAAKYYREAAALFLTQADMYNEMHAREGLYKVTKTTAPDEAMMHLERAKLLRDSIYSQETAEAISRYNAQYNNDILQKDKETAEKQKRIIIVLSIMLAVIVAVLVTVGIILLRRKHKREKEQYEKDLLSLQGQYTQVNRWYQNIIAEKESVNRNLTDDDRQFIEQLTEAIETDIEKGVPEMETIATRMHTNTGTIRRRLSQTLSITPQTFILQVRMNKAKYLLENYRDITVAEVAEKCGYSQLGNFTRAFTNYFGITPSAAKLKTIEN